VNRADLAGILQNIPLTAVEINFSVSKNHLKLAQLLSEYFTTLQVDINLIKGSVAFDPIGNMTTQGTSDASLPETINQLVAHFSFVKNNLPQFRAIGINAAAFANAGASGIQELAFGLAMASEYFSILLSNNFTAADILPRMQITMAVGTNYFPEIAKFRAIRLLWSAVVAEYNPEIKNIAKIHVHAETATFNKTIYDPFVNMLRTTTEAMAAIIGGIQSLTVKAFNGVYEPETAFGSRIARNQQLIIKEESYFDKVADPSAGSYYIESLTNTLATKAWELFVETEDNGGYTKLFKENSIQTAVADMANTRDMHIANRREILLGTNQYPNQSDKAAMHSNFLNSLKHPETENPIINPLKIYRGAEAFEALRLKTEQMPYQPKVFLFTFGNITMRKARAMFSVNFFACAGFQIIDNNGFDTIEQGVADAVKQHADVVVVCSSDDEYAVIAPEIYTKLKNQCLVVVAGAPACMPELNAVGITEFIHVKSDLLATLQHFQQLLINKK